MKQRALSGKKYQTDHGHMAIKNGIKQRGHLLPVTDLTSSPPKPPWLRVRLRGNGRFESVRDAVRSQQLATVCEESHCPNISECWGQGTATLMLMGAVCTRACRFCAVDTGNPGGWLDEDEPLKVAESVR
ncbi:MAG: lipoyl synthase, partial [Pseudomonadota bacterium]|nr:lipoyl synthase [Pseudomonadota bacterium]